MMAFKQNDRVWIAKHGEGQVLLDRNATVVVRFDHGIEECAASDLQTRQRPASQLEAAEWSEPGWALARAQAEAIRSIDATWGVFSASRIELLPHQLWVCKTVLSSMPARWLVADDVGLGKSVEAGLICLAMKQRGLLGRLLVLCPASLVEQWQHRLFTMFDIRTVRYNPVDDTKRLKYWEMNDQVVASFHTLRADRDDRHERFLSAEPWDLVIVDEAHHFNADEHAGPTLGYELLKVMSQRERVRSCVFFTGTPHRGKDFGFLALLSLLHPDRFNPRLPLAGQLEQLPSAMIRNNKYRVTDLAGTLLFQEPVVTRQTFAYSASEREFYDTLTSFIVSGKAYAQGLDESTQGRAVMLVLIAMQKLASSSIAAIRRAIRGRLERLTAAPPARTGGAAPRVAVDPDDAQGQLDLDEAARFEEETPAGQAELLLMANEAGRLAELLQLADQVGPETKMASILEWTRALPHDRSALFFTEYKATQSLLMSCLMQEHGAQTVAFINGDEEAREVVAVAGQAPRTIRARREDAAAEFNEGRVRFLVSTEAAGEGIDLQARCHTLVHVDLPWNPMRLHQRVGRLNRYGQAKQVEVLVFHNPRTVESRIWMKLTEKLERINQALARVMPHQEDLMPLILGMAAPALFGQLFADAPQGGEAGLDEWFDATTASLGGEDVVKVVKGLVGHSRCFDYGEASAIVPRVDVRDLSPFFQRMVKLRGRRVSTTDGGLEFLTPDEWRGPVLVKKSYKNVMFERPRGNPGTGEREWLDVRSPVVEQALKDACSTTAALEAVADLGGAPWLAVFKVRDRVTTTDALVTSSIVGVAAGPSGQPAQLLLDWQLLQRLYATRERSGAVRTASEARAAAQAAAVQIDVAAQYVLEHVDRLQMPLQHPEVEFLAACVAVG